LAGRRRTLLWRRPGFVKRSDLINFLPQLALDRSDSQNPGIVKYYFPKAQKIAGVKPNFMKNLS